METNNTPIYKVIEKDLRVAILDGTLKQGDMIPSETELSAKYKVTRMTVRQAINNLLIDGYIYRHKGKGTFVTFNKKEMSNNVEEPLFSFAREMIGIGSPVDTIVASLREEAADEIVAQRLQLKTGDKIYYVERIRKYENTPLVYERLYLPKNMYHDLKEDIFRGSFHDYIQNELGFNIKKCVRSIEARAIGEKVADIFHQSVGEPSLYMSSVAYLDNGRAYMYSRQYFHGNHFRFKHTFSN